MEDFMKIRKKISQKSKIGALSYLMDTDDFEDFVKEIHESPENATLRGSELLTGEGELLIRKAVQWGCFECVEVLVENGANVNEDMSRMRETIFLNALKMHEYKIALYLLNHGADPQKGDYSFHLRAYNISTEDEYNTLLERLKSGDLI